MKCKPHQDTPGLYKIIDRTFATDKLDHESTKTVDLYPDLLVNVLEIVIKEDSCRVRARISEPEGWITLLRTNDGKRFAEKVQTVI